MTRLYVIYCILFSLSVYAQQIPPEKEAKIEADIDSDLRLSKKELSEKKIAPIDSTRLQLPHNFVIDARDYRWLELTKLWDLRHEDDQNPDTDEADSNQKFLDVSGTLESGFMRWRRRYWYNAKQELMAYGAIRYFRTARIYDVEGKRIGKISKRWFTWWSGRPVIDIYDRHDQLVAQATLNTDRNNHNSKVITLRYLQTTDPETDNNYNATFGKFQWQYEKEQQNFWNVTLYHKLNKTLVREDRVDPRLIPFIPVYIDYWDNVKTLDAL